MRAPTPLTYFWTWLALIALSGVTMVISQLASGALGALLALGIAALKVVLIALFFMHLIEQASNAIVLVGALILVAFFVGLTAADAPTRQIPVRPPVTRDP